MSSIVKVDTIQENTSANGITVDGLNIKDSKLVTANSVIASNITADAIDATKIANNAISEEHLDVTSITGHSAETSVATDDLILISDTSASGALKKMTRANFVSGVGENNRPYLKAAMHPSGTTTLSNETTTKVAFNQQLVSVDGTYSESDARWTPGVAGRYFIQAQIFIDWGNASGQRLDTAIRVNNTAKVEARLRAGADLGGSSPAYIAGIVTLDDDDYVEIFCFGGMGANKDFDKNQAYTWFNGFKIANT